MFPKNAMSKVRFGKSVADIVVCTCACQHGSLERILPILRDPYGLCGQVVAGVRERAVQIEDHVHIRRSSSLETQPTRPPGLGFRPALNECSLR